MKYNEYVEKLIHNIPLVIAILNIDGDSSRVLSDGDILALFPPVGGG